MKKFLHNLRAWLRGEELEFEYEIPVAPLLLVGAIILFFILKACL